MQTLEQLHHALRQRVGTDDVLRLVSTRVFLRTGVNLKEIRREQNADPAAVQKVLGFLKDLGYVLP